MLHIPFIKENIELVIKGLQKKGILNVEEILNHIIELDELRKATQKKIDDLRHIIKNHREDGRIFKEKIKLDEIELTRIENEIFNELIKLPNVPHITVTEGKTAKENENVKQVGNTEQKGIPHWELIKKYDLIDFETGNKITGKGFPVYKNKAAKLQRALINFFLDEAEKAGYNETQVPILVNEATCFATGQLPDKESQMYKATEDNLYLIPTAEVPLTNIYRDVLLKPEQLPIKMVGYTPCFRREAGSWGADVRGLNRLHQFDKVELVQIVEPQESYKVLEQMVNYVETLLQKLNLNYRILRLCGGDMSFNSALTYDFETYCPGQDRWLEVSSVSNFETFQAKRLKLRTKNGLLHTLNGSALALPRIMATILEQYQTEDGIEIPDVLKKYITFERI